MAIFHQTILISVVNAMPPVQVIQPEPHPRQFDGILEDGVIGILNLDLDPSVPDEQL